MANPTYEVRAGWIPQTWESIIGSGYTWAGLSTEWTWQELASGLVSAADVQRITVTRQAVTLFSALTPGRCDLVLFNEAGNYSPDGTTYSVRPLQRIHVQAVTDAGSIYKMFTGKVESIRLNPQLGQRDIAFSATDEATELQRTVSLSLQLAINVTSLFTDIASVSGWHMIRTDISSTNDEIPYAFLDNLPAGDALEKTAEAGAHLWYIDGGAKLVMRDRNYDYNQSLSVVASFDNTFLGLTYQMDRGRLYNDINIRATRRSVSTSVNTIAWLDEKVFLAQSEQLVATLQYVDPDNTERGLSINALFGATDAFQAGTPATSVSITQSADWIFNTTSDDTGTDLTSALAVSLTPYAQTADVVVTNNSSLGGYLTKFQLRGYLLRQQPPILSISRDGDSIAEFGRRTLDIRNELVPNATFSRDYAAWLKERYKDPHAALTMSLKNEFPQVLDIELLDIISVGESITNIASRFIVTGVTHNIATDRSLEHSVRYDIDLAVNKDYLVLDVDTFDGTKVWGF